MKDETRRMILTGVFVSLIGCLLSIVIFSVQMEKKNLQLHIDCEQEISDYVNTIQLTSYGWNTKEDYLGAVIHGSMIINQFKGKCKSYDK